MPFIEGVGDLLTQPLYDELPVLAAGTTQLVYFSQPVGQAGKTILNTNMQLAGQVQAGYKMNVLALAISFRLGTLRSNIVTCLDTAFGQFNIASKWWWQSPLRFLPGGVGLAYFSNEAAAAALQAASNGVADPRAIYTLRQPIAITQTESFNFTVAYAAAVAPTVDTQMTVALHGELTRTVQ